MQTSFFLLINTFRFTKEIRFRFRFSFNLYASIFASASPRCFPSPRSSRRGPLSTLCQNTSYANVMCLPTWFVFFSPLLLLLFVSSFSRFHSTFQFFDQPAFIHFDVLLHVVGNLLSYHKNVLFKVCFEMCPSLFCHSREMFLFLRNFCWFSWLGMSFAGYPFERKASRHTHGPIRLCCSCRSVPFPIPNSYNSVRNARSDATATGPVGVLRPLCRSSACRLCPTYTM